MAPFIKDSFRDWRDALDEALRLNAVCVEKFGGPPWLWRYRVCKYEKLWRVYTPSFSPPRGPK